MSETEIVKMSGKGQLVVPEGIRSEEGFAAGDIFVPIPVKEGILFKRVKLPEIKIEFEKLVKDIESRFKKEKITQKVVREGVRWARRESS